MDKSKFDKSLPYLIGLAVFLTILAAHMSVKFMLWWLGVTVGTAIFGLLGMTIADDKNEEGFVGFGAKTISVISFFALGLSLLFGIVAVVDAIFPSLLPSGYENEDLTENWRR